MNDIIVSQLGYLPEAQEKIALLPNPRGEDKFAVLSLETRHVHSKREHNKASQCIQVFEGNIQFVADDFGSYGVMDFSSVHTPGLYQIIVEGKRSHPFFIRSDVYMRTAYETFYYSHIQRCGCEVPGWHQACHLDDGVRSDTGEHVSVSGGWHDAGDLRKWVDHTLWQAIGMNWPKKRWNIKWSQYADDDILDELQWGNRYFLNMIDPDTGLVWHDVGGDEIDNVWTNNVPGDGDDRTIGTQIGNPGVQWKFSWVQAMMALRFATHDKEYSSVCQKAGERVYHAANRAFNPTQLDTFCVSTALLAATELYQVTGLEQYLMDARSWLQELLYRQEQDFVGDQHNVKGFFYHEHEKKDIFFDWWQAALAAYAMVNVIEALPDPESSMAEKALLDYAEGYLLPLTKTNVFGVIPAVVRLRRKTHDQYRTLEGDIQYRYFLETCNDKSERKEFLRYGQGTNTYLLGQAAVLFHCYRRFGKSQFLTAGLKQLEWVHGLNPLGVCLVSHRGVVHPYPHSRYLGMIPGGVLNGITGDERDHPHLGGANYDLEWQTLEYWSPNQAQYLMGLCELHQHYALDTEIGARY